MGDRERAACTLPPGPAAKGHREQEVDDIVSKDSRPVNSSVGDRAEGRKAYTRSMCSRAEGRKAYTRSMCSRAEGRKACTRSMCSRAEGRKAYTRSMCSRAEGRKAYTRSMCSRAEGRKACTRSGVSREFGVCIANRRPSRMPCLVLPCRSRNRPGMVRSHRGFAKDAL